MLTLEQAERAHSTAEQALRELNQGIAAEQRAAALVIAERHADEVAVARRALEAARRALIAAKDATPDHPMTGKAVYQMVETRRYSFDASRLVRVDGIVETRRSTTAFPGNTADYRLPRMGDGFVRLLKKDGTPGTKFERLESYSGKLLWSLVEEQQDAAA